MNFRGKEHRLLVCDQEFRKQERRMCTSHGLMPEITAIDKYFQWDGKVKTLLHYLNGGDLAFSFVVITDGDELSPSTKVKALYLRSSRFGSLRVPTGAYLYKDASWHYTFNKELISDYKKLKSIKESTAFSPKFTGIKLPNNSLKQIENTLLQRSHAKGA